MSPLPETILQFGAGRFLRAFVDRFVHQANESGQNVGRIVVVQRAADQRSEVLHGRPEGYQVLVRGYRDGELIERPERVQSISRMLLADRNWQEVLAFAKMPALRFIVSNATESGYVLEARDRLDAAPPATLAAKLTQVLWSRFQSGAAPVTMLPCELIERNADKLKELILTQSRTWGLPADFQKWVGDCLWLNSLVDCIVTMPEPALAQSDPLLICAEPYYLWALEKPAGRSVKLFEHPAIRLADDIAPYFLRKVRILNGTHTAMVGKFLGQFETVQALLADKSAARWIRDLMYGEIVPTLAYRLDLVAAFADETFDRFRNPFTNHKLADISKGHADKVKVRLAPTRAEYERLFGKPPPRIVEAMKPFTVR
jgi:tagaturonate reductase